MNALEQSFWDIVRKHDLTHLQVCVNNPGGDYAGHKWCVDAHWNGYTNSGHTCTHGYADNIADALAECLANVAKCRAPAPVSLADEPLTEPLTELAA